MEQGKIHSQKIRLTTVLIWCGLCLKVCPGAAFDYDMPCVPGSLPLNMRTLLFATVDTSTVTASNCAFMVISKVIFRIVTPDSTLQTICEVPGYPTCNMTLQTNGQQACKCESQKGSINSYQLDFFFNESYINRTLKITTNCIPKIGITFTENVCMPSDACLNKNCSGHGICIRPNGTCQCEQGYHGDDCGPIKPTCDFCQCNDCEDNGGCWGCIVLFVVGPIVVGGIIGGIVFCLHKKGIISCPCCHKTDSHPVNNPAGNNMSMTGSGAPNSGNKNPNGRRKVEKEQTPAETRDMTHTRDVPSSRKKEETQPTTMAQQGDKISSRTPGRLDPVVNTPASKLPSVERNSARDLPLPKIHSNAK